MLHTHLDIDSDIVSTHHVCVRYCEMHGIPWLDWGDAVVPSIDTDYTVVYKNKIHDNGWTADPDEENDSSGVTAAPGSGYTWVLENEMYHMGGDAIIATTPGIIDYSLSAHHLYIGRNKLYDCIENAIDIKCAIDVIISENDMHTFVRTDFPVSGSDGTALVIHYQPDRVWVLNNTIPDACNGIRCNGAGLRFCARVEHTRRSNRIHLIRPLSSSPERHSGQASRQGTVPRFCHSFTHDA
jgi:hypothetical protein